MGGLTVLPSRLVVVVVVVVVVVMVGSRVKVAVAVAVGVQRMRNSNRNGSHAKTVIAWASAPIINTVQNRGRQYQIQILMDGSTTTSNATGIVARDAILANELTVP